MQTICYTVLLNLGRTENKGNRRGKKERYEFCLFVFSKGKGRNVKGKKQFFIFLNRRVRKGYVILQIYPFIFVILAFFVKVFLS